MNKYRVVNYKELYDTHPDFELVNGCYKHKYSNLQPSLQNWNLIYDAVYFVLQASNHKLDPYYVWSIIHNDNI
jgi:hypothetical protein